MRRRNCYITIIICLLLLETGCFVSASKYRRDTDGLEKLAAKKTKEYNKLANEHEALVKENEKLEEENALLLSALDAKETTHSMIVADLTKDNKEIRDKNKILSSENADLREKIVKVSQKKKKEINALKTTYDILVDDMQEEIEEGKIRITQLEDEVSVSIVDKILFKSGEVKVKQAGRKILKRLGDILKKVKGKQIKIEGHTDNVPIGPDLRSKYASNWELSAARAINVAKYLRDEVGIDPSLLFAAAYSQYRPIASNRTETGRAKNRRIEIVLIPMDMEEVIEE